MSMMFQIRFELNKRKVLVKNFFASTPERAIEEAKDWADNLPPYETETQYGLFDYDRIIIQ